MNAVLGAAATLGGVWALFNVQAWRQALYGELRRVRPLGGPSEPATQDGIVDTDLGGRGLNGHAVRGDQGRQALGVGMQVFGIRQHYVLL